MHHPLIWQLDKPLVLVAHPLAVTKCRLLLLPLWLKLLELVFRVGVSIGVGVGVRVGEL